MGCQQSTVDRNMLPEELWVCLWQAEWNQICTHSSCSRAEWANACMHGVKGIEGFNIKDLRLPTSFRQEEVEKLLCAKGGLLSNALWRMRGQWEMKNPNGGSWSCGAERTGEPLREHLTPQ